MRSAVVVRCSLSMTPGVSVALMNESGMQAPQFCGQVVPFVLSQRLFHYRSGKLGADFICVGQASL